MRTNGFLKAFWALTKPYWVSEKRGKALGLLVLVVALALAMVYMEVQFNYWNRDFYNTFEKKDQAEFFYQLGKFGVLAFAWIIMAVYRLWFLQMLQIEWAPGSPITSSRNGCRTRRTTASSSSTAARTTRTSALPTT